MGKNRKSKRQLVRDEKRAKKRGRELAEDEERSAKRQRQHDDDEHDVAQTSNNDLFTLDPNADHLPFDDEHQQPPQLHDESGPAPRARGGNFEREFFGMLAEQEQEYFRHADEMLELNDFPSEDDRHIFLQSVYREARGKELKLASSQSCSRLMERLIMLSNAKQKKSLFGAFAGHFMTLVTHRFASHCCEKLFLMSAPVVTAELTGAAAEEDVEMEDATGGDDDGVTPEVAEAVKTPMEDLLMLTLDEFEEHLSFLLSDRYGSHALRVLLVVLSGRPLNQAGTKSLLQGKSKEYITVEGAAGLSGELSEQTRTVPSSFSTAIQKIIGDATANLDSTALRVLAKHPTGNPTLQLLLELELSLTAKAKKGSKKEETEKPADGATESESTVSLLDRLVPDAPGAFGDEKSQACEFVNGMLYDPIGSRLLETLIAHCPGKIFKGLHANIFGPRIQSLLRNDIASYPAIKVLNRLSKEDLADAVQKSLPEIGSFVEKGRLNVIKTLFERCNVRGATAELTTLLQALTTACGGNWKHLVPKLCLLNDPEPEPETKEKKFQTPEAKNKAALLSHGSQIVSTLLSIPGPPSKAIQNSLLALQPAHLLRMATSSPTTATILTKSLTTPPQIPHFHKLLVASLLPNIYPIATTHHGNAIICEIIAVPSKTDSTNTTPVVPFHLKENIMAQLARHEHELRETWLGRNVWRTWKGDLWGHRRHDWVRWAKETDPEGARVAAMPKVKGEEGGKRGSGKAVEDVRPEVEERPEFEERPEPEDDMEIDVEGDDERKDEGEVNGVKEKTKKEKKDKKEKKEKKKKDKASNGEASGTGDAEGEKEKVKKKKKKSKEKAVDVAAEVEAST